MTHDGLRGFAVDVEPALTTDFHGTQLYSCGFWCQGPTLLQMLNILESRDLRALGHNSAPYIHLLTEAIKLAFADREVHYGDPRHKAVPQDSLLSKAYTRERSEEHTSELQSLMRISYAVFCLTKKKENMPYTNTN